MTSAHRQRFLANRGENLFDGRFACWDEAVLAANEAAVAAGGDAAGYDSASSARLYTHRVRLDAHDYPALYWLCRSVSEGRRSVLDVGGATGIKAMAFRDGLLAALAAGQAPVQTQTQVPTQAPGPASASLNWLVQDVPAMVAEGQRQAAARGEALAPLRLAFTDRFDEGRGCEVLLASGVLQYLPATLAELLGAWPAGERPLRIVVNTTALHATTAYFTVNSIGTGFCAYRVQTQAELVRGLAALGYRPRESWPNLGKVLELPEHPELSLTQYSGLCLDRVG